MIYRVSEQMWEDTKGQTYTREEYEQKLPLMFEKQLITSGLMPNSIKGVELDMRIISREKSFFRLKVDEIDAPDPKLYPLFESQSGRAKIDLPDDFFRITWRIEFIEAATNRILEEKSQLFSGTLYRNGFTFPSKIIAGLPTPRKSCDEGYLIVDAKDQLFHLKMIKGKPFVRRVEIPKGLKFRYIKCVDFRNKDFYAYLFSEKDEIYILTQDDYQLIKWPVDGIKLSKCDLKIYGDLFNYTVVAESDDQLKAIALNKEFQVVNTYTEPVKLKKYEPEGKFFAALFPVQVSMNSVSSKFVRFYVSFSEGFNWLIVNLLFVLLHFVLLFRKKANFINQITDIAIVAATGIFGFIAVNFFPNKYFD